MSFGIFLAAAGCVLITLVMTTYLHFRIAMLVNMGVLPRRTLKQFPLGGIRPGFIFSRAFETMPDPGVRRLVYPLRIVTILSIITMSAFFITIFFGGITNGVGIRIRM